MTDAVVAVDQRGGRGAIDGADFGLRIAAAGLQRVAIHAEAEDAVRIEAGDIGLDHLSGCDRGIGFGHAVGDERVVSERGHRRDRIPGVGH